MTSVLKRDREKPGEDRGRDWRGAATSQSARSWQKLEGANRTLPESPRVAARPDNTWILDFGPPRPAERNFYCFQLPSLWSLIVAALRN